MRFAPAPSAQSIVTAACTLALGILAFGTPALAQDAEVGGLIRELSSQLGGVQPGSDAGASLSGRLIQLFVLTTALSVAPGLLVVTTSFTRFVIVFSMLRLALGLNQTPPNIVLNAMALFMTFFVMQPVFEDAWEGGLRPLMANTITEEQAIQNITEPFYNFMVVNTRPKDIQLFTDIANDTNDDDEGDVAQAVDAGPSWRVLVPSFMISELRRAFTIGFLIYLPFVAIDLIVASVLMSAGMMMLPPVLVSLPFKVIFFVLIDGWYMLAGSLIQSYLSG
ncbi:flagellar type III secretion system pore protein FliP [Sulfitobacter sp. M57]|uniref:flagellar type III secretion system pore protein FliP n=1 Tax=unclassified Sulfitobacter TaxID=196795 RepID=UPI0023E174DC|nr:MULTISPECIES: flagellar type III secretion system pore protein FliP [unclassified Sulfitobacter]MDF3414835.1 flagellar type III secretion system pore protein FliP [Sulfitobacter sp. KE5]MDF3422316.1 flagellar type III secretion system pore protein FliP [Sulfitobacter sp. KE43]MDF3433381.1 flagellar type III secretion system pore protein FliP [Sulfitobacter sp. KE42]MDF3459021.1 flagellar type III secretion system pore protein FliP [Sulfitobacter sp. S74]MDF3462920.1 flagellar type III secre